MTPHEHDSVFRSPHRREEFCAVLPAAGRGTRLGTNLPKILTPLGHGETVMRMLCRKLLTVVGHINIIASPDGEPLIRVAAEREASPERISLSIQPQPIGMGDAIFRGYSIWSRFKTIIVVWGDQLFVSKNTLAGACASHGSGENTVVVPVVPLPQPYVEYLFAKDGKLAGVRQSREGDICTAGGYGDVGTFVLSTAGLNAAWKKFLTTAGAGKLTGETNFLPFIPYLAARGWNVKPYRVSDAREARGINTLEDLAFFTELIGRESGGEDDQSG